MVLYDSHAHLNLPPFEPDLEAVIVRAARSGVRVVLCPGVDAASSRRALELAKQFPDILFAAVGIHPTAWSDATAEEMSTIEEMATRPEVVAIGETGLDLHRQPDALQAQSEGFLRHIALAHATGKPLVVHARKADAEVLEILRREGGVAPRGVRHCFDRDAETAGAYLELGFHISLAAHLTRPGYRRLKAAARRLPADRLLVETDCPYQSPHSKRGQRNEPGFILETVEALARLRDLTVEQIADLTARNAVRLFGTPAME